MADPITSRPTATIHQINDLGRKPLPARSAPDWFIDNESNTQDRQYGKVFSQPTQGNLVRFYTTGQEYFQEVAKAIEAAEKCVFITGWQINFDVTLTGKKRLFDCLATAVDKGVHVYVMPWLSPKAGVDTGDFDTMLAVFQLNAGSPLGKAHVMPAVQQSDMGGLSIGFSHHQKQIVIDNKKAFVGGIDLAYGRRDDARFSLKADGRQGCELYNPCIPATWHIPGEKKAQYLTRGELFLACVTSLTAPVMGVPNAAKSFMDAVTPDAFGEWLAQPTDWDEFTVVKWSKYVREATAQLHGKVTSKAIDFASRRMAWAYQQLPGEIRQEVERVYDIGSVQVLQSAESILFSWMNNGSLRNVSAEAASSASLLTQTLLIRAYGKLHDNSDKLEKRYKYLVDGGVMLPPDGMTINPSEQPRMPWQDVQACVEGPSVFDLSTNFIQRWNSIQKRMASGGFPTAGKHQALQHLIRAFGLNLPTKENFVLPQHLPIRSKEKVGTCTVQVLRSAPKLMLEDENKAMSSAAGRKQDTSHAQDNCLKAMVQAIGSAQRFIYIEGQFFQSEHGGSAGFQSEKLSGPLGALLDWKRLPGYEKFKTALNLEAASIAAIPAAAIRWSAIPEIQTDPDYPQFKEGLKRVLANKAQIKMTRALAAPQPRLLNPIGQALGERIARAIGDRVPFHVYLVLPVHPEGTLDTLNIMNQVHLTMQSLVFGENSLVNRIRRALYVRQLIKEEGLTYQAARVKAERLPIEELKGKYKDDWEQYLTLLNLRNWDTFIGKPVTEQIYVHSKLLIADDRVAILGSANINDRSMLGDRDSELAIIVRDNNEIRKPINGKNLEPVSAAVQKLRADLWRKHFGITGGVRPATVLESVIDKPGDPSTWKIIQHVAKDNMDEYNKTFNYVARNESVFNQKTPGSIWPTWQYADPKYHEKGGHLKAPMPFELGFWKKSAVAVKAPAGIQGFIVSLPIDWTFGENNDSGMSMALLAANDRAKSSIPGTTIADNYDIAKSVPNVSAT